MCSPIGHSLLGLIYYYIFNKGYNLFRHWKEVLIYLFFANLPDIDFIPLLWGDIDLANNWHHTYTHTLGFAIICSCLAYLFRKKERLKFSLIVFLLVYTHIIVDCLTYDTRDPYGVRIFWPFSDFYFYSGCPIFAPLKKLTMASLFSWFNVKTMGSEILKLGPIVLILFFYRWKKAKP